MPTDHGASVAAAAAATPSNSSNSDPSSKAKLTFFSLPSETQLEIISHCSQSDLICVALVSKRFHELASTHLYQNFHIIFPDEDDIHFDSPIDGLAGGLDTLTTSNYNYAKHLKDIFMDTLSAGTKGESSYQPYLYSASCGKFLNTLLYLTLKRSKSLEAFRWNIRVELSRPVYQELHKIASLKTLHIRMQAGESYYIPPPPLPVSIEPHPVASTSTHWNHWPDMPSPSNGSMLIMAGPSGLNTTVATGSPPSLGATSKSLPKSKADRRGSVAKDPSTLSGFKKLRSLSVLDIDDLDIVTELNTCVKNSSSTLTELKLSFSDSLAAQARKPPPDTDPEDSDVEEEFQIIPLHQTNSYTTSGPAKAFRAQEERRVQEAVLGRIFDIEPATAKKTESRAANKEGEASLGEGDDKDETNAARDPREEFLESLQSISTKLMTLLTGSRNFSVSQQEILDTIEKAAKKYVAAADYLPVKAHEASNPPLESGQPLAENNKQPNKDVSATEGSSSNTASGDKEASEEISMKETESETHLQETTQPTRRSKAKRDASLDDIDIAHLESLEDAFNDDDDQAPEAKGRSDESLQTDQPSDIESVTSKQPTPTVTFAAIDSALPEERGNEEEEQHQKPSHLQAQAHGVTFDELIEKLGQFQEYSEALKRGIDGMRAQGADVESSHISKAEVQIRTFNNYMEDIQGQIQMIEQEIAEKRRGAAANSSEADAVEHSMKQYIRNTRGLSLATLSLHLIPVKSSILSRAVNLSCLKQLTLLNVGIQAPIWTMLLRENKMRPLAIRSIFTDNVSPAFLTFASQLEAIHELFLLERDTKFNPQSFAPRTETTIDQIRRLVLKKHIGTLKRLMIKDESNGPDWDANEKAMILICTRGRQLEELAVSMNIHAVHAFMQYFSGLVNLRAINILRFRNNDTCIWVVREILRFIVDNLSHHPELKLEYIAMEDDRVDRVVRPPEAETMGSTNEHHQSVKSKGNGKGKAPMVGATQHDAFPSFTSEGLDSESDSEEEAFDSGTRLRFKTLGPLQFYDVWGVKIFEKEIRSGRL